MPFFKVLEGMPFAVDAFCYGKINGCTDYFLTHFHSDHYRGLSRKWDNGPIYCTHVTAALVQSKLRVAKEFVRPLPMDQAVTIPGTSVRVTCIDANHCPGACLFLFEGPTKNAKQVRYLHCGDFRATPWHVRHPSLAGGVDIIYLDTTYLSPEHCFPSQKDVLEVCANVVRAPVTTGAASSISSWLGMSQKSGNVLVVIGTYSIGKERVVAAVAHALGTKVFCVDSRQSQVYQQTGALDGLLTQDALAARVHVVGMSAVTVAGITAWLAQMKRRGASVTHAIGIKPTGWTFRGGSTITPDTPVETVMAIPRTLPPPSPSRDSTSTVRLYSIPYSEHSSFVELMAFCVSLPHKRIIPTVGNTAAQHRMEKFTRRWTALASLGTQIGDSW
ncbi:DNA cross-link repair protein PSO2/SNM1 [Malassezia cuniculi]|uniref:DNA cross-link repair protein PSO2/SNM1 n=1 Tax=Malassezia cuniculi TaxID=948313 RepID=A0AAF0J6E8_9BASI|nr:DNA cross-link repair protein PSO2/SNM1 [Malassezia cuniculi]